MRSGKYCTWVWSRSKCGRPGLLLLLSSHHCITAIKMTKKAAARWITCLRNCYVWEKTAQQRLHSTCQSLPVAQEWTCRTALLASTCCAHFAYFSASHFSQPCYHRRAEGCIAVRSRLGSGRSSKGWKCWYNAIALIKNAHSKFGFVEILDHKIFIVFKNFQKFPTILMCKVHFEKLKSYAIAVVHRSPGNVCTCTARGMCHHVICMRMCTWHVYLQQTMLS